MKNIKLCVLVSLLLPVAFTNVQSFEGIEKAEIVVGQRIGEKGVNAKGLLASESLWLIGKRN
jgi:hypothetical protein